MTRAIPGDLAYVAKAFRDLQEARHGADYNFAHTFKKQDAAGLVKPAEAAHKKWQSVRKHNAARVFSWRCSCSTTARRPRQEHPEDALDIHKG